MPLLRTEAHVLRGGSQKYRVTSFRNARKVLGPAYVVATADHPNYREAVTIAQLYASGEIDRILTRYGKQQLRNNGWITVTEPFMEPVPSEAGPTPVQDDTESHLEKLEKAVMDLQCDNALLRQQMDSGFAAVQAQFALTEEKLRHEFQEGLHALEQRPMQRSSPNQDDWKTSSASKFKS